MLLNELATKKITEQDTAWKDWAKVGFLLLATLGCISTSALDWEKFSKHRLACSGLGTVAAIWAIAEIRSIEEKAFLLSQRKAMRVDYVTEQSLGVGMLETKQKQLELERQNAILEFEHQQELNRIIGQYQGHQPQQHHHPRQLPPQPPMIHEEPQGIEKMTPPVQGGDDTVIQSPQTIIQPEENEEVVYEAFNGIDVFPLDPIKLKKQNTGLLVCGSSGSAKTTLVRWCLPFWIAEGYQVIVLDPHADPEHPEYPWADFPYVIGDRPLIFKQIKILLDLLEKKDRTKVICICDEWTDLLGFAQLEDRSTFDLLRNFLVRWGTGGRKFGKFLIGIGHTDNVEMWGLKGVGGLLRNFGILRLGDIATRCAEFQGTTDNPLHEYCKGTAYPLLVDTVPHLHPTHGHYQVKENEQPPANLQPLHFHELTIPYVMNQEKKRLKPPTEAPPAMVQPELQKVEEQPPSDPRAHLEALFKKDGCPECGSLNVRNNGTTGAGTPRKRCNDCGKSWAAK